MREHWFFHIPARMYKPPLAVYNILLLRPRSEGMYGQAQFCHWQKLQA
jgi:hypothetical protein